VLLVMSHLCFTARPKPGFLFRLKGETGGRLVPAMSVKLVMSVKSMIAMSVKPVIAVSTKTVMPS
jgi:hypothetical protein